jgi:AraC family transcriptional regulator
MTITLSHPLPRILHSSAGRGWTALDADFVHIPRGKAQAPGGDRHVLGMHFGPPVRAECAVGGTRMRGVQTAGDMDFIPAGMDGSWEDDADCRILRLSLAPSLLDRAAEDLGRDPAAIDLAPRLHLRDARIEAIGWAIKADLEAEAPSDPLYIDLLTTALAVRLIEIASGDRAPPARAAAPGLSARQLRTLIDHIETHLDQRLHLADLAAVAGVSVTRLKMLFRASTGAPVHQYVIRRRAEQARTLIATTAMPASEVALAAGFAHQSHMAATMRRIFGQTPSEIVRPSRKI